MTDDEVVLDRIARLEEENRRYADQLKRLAQAENDVSQSRRQLDAQLRIYRQLYDVGKRLNATFAVADIVGITIEFTLYELNFERCALMLAERDRPFFRVRGADGYYDDDEAAAIARLELAADHPLVAQLGERGGAFTYTAGGGDPAAAALAAELRLDEYAILSLVGESQRVVGLLVTGNQAARFAYQARVEDELVMLGLHNLATQVSTALSNATLYQELEEERAQLEEKVAERTVELSEAMEDLKKLDELKTQFFSNVSHELRTPLTLSIGPLEMLLDGEAVVEPVARTLRVVHTNQLRLLKLINELLDFSRLEAGKMTTRFRRIDLTGALRTFVGTLEAAAESRRLTLLLEGDIDAPLEVYVDVEKLEKIAMNLLSNAFKFTPDGGTIAVRVERDEGSVRVHVRDTGIGIAADQIDRLFNRFTQLDSSEKRHYSGTGIGLAMVKELMELHGGRVTVTSRPGAGSTFTLHLRRGCDHLPADAVVDDELSAVDSIRSENVVEFAPEDAEAAAPAPAPATTRREEEIELAAAPLLSLDGARVLVVDDTAGMRQMIHQVLSPHFQVFTAVDGQAGLEAAREILPDLIVSDVMMPRMSGTELCSAVKSDPGPLSRTPVILVTARAEMSLKLQGLDHGADDYLVKPFNHEELLKRSRNAIRIRRQERLLAQLERRALEKDLEVAGAVQSLLIPAGDHETGAMRLAAHYEPAARAGGDWWWYHDRADRSFRLLMGDITGHGVGAAMVTAAVAATYRILAKRANGLGVGQLIEALDEGLKELCHGDYWMTLSVVDVHPGDRRMSLWSAGAPPVLTLRPGGSVDALVSGGNPLGSDSFSTETMEVDYRAGQRLFVFTDGIPELSVKGGRPLGIRRLGNLCRRTAGASVGEARSTIVRELRELQAKPTLDDDLALVVLEMQ